MSHFWGCCRHIQVRTNCLCINCSLTISWLWWRCVASDNYLTREDRFWRNNSFDNVPTLFQQCGRLWRRAQTSTSARWSTPRMTTTATTNMTRQVFSRQISRVTRKEDLRLIICRKILKKNLLFSLFFIFNNHVRKRCLKGKVVYSWSPY